MCLFRVEEAEKCFGREVKSYGGADVMHATPLTSSISLDQINLPGNFRYKTLHASSKTMSNNFSLVGTNISVPSSSSIYSTPSTCCSSVSSSGGRRRRLTFPKLSFSLPSITRQGLYTLGYIAHGEYVWISIRVNLQGGFD